MLIRVAPRVVVDEVELVESFLRASGPGGQNVNKVETAVELRYDAHSSPHLPDDVRERLRGLAGSRMTADGVIIIVAQRFRTQERNREDARERLFDLLRKAAVRPAVRRPTKPTLGSKQRRLEGKSRRGAVKKLRTQKPPSD